MIRTLGITDELKYQTLNLNNGVWWFFVIIPKNNLSDNYLHYCIMSTVTNFTSSSRIQHSIPPQGFQSLKLLQKSSAPICRTFS